MGIKLMFLIMLLLVLLLMFYFRIIKIIIYLMIIVGIFFGYKYGGLCFLFYFRNLLV